MHRYARRRGAGRWSPPALTLRGYWWALALVAAAIQLLTVGLVTAGILARAGAFALASLWLGSALVGIFLVTGTTSVTRRGVSLAQGLAAAAREVARTGRARPRIRASRRRRASPGGGR